MITQRGKPGVSPPSKREASVSIVFGVRVFDTRTDFMNSQFRWLRKQLQSYRLEMMGFVVVARGVEVTLHVSHFAN